MSSETNLLSTFSDQLAQAVARAGESTVQVNGRRRMPASGIAYAADLILTADHVVERDEDLSVMLPNGASISASIAGRAPGNDLALLRLEKSSATPAEKVIKETQVGEIVVALGRPSQDGIEASLGLVGASGGPARTSRGGLLERYLRTDTTPFPGFSGGPLIDTQGKVVGLNTSGFAHGVAITIPIELAWSDAENLAKYGYIKRGYLGVRSQSVSLTPDMRNTLSREQEAGLFLFSIRTSRPAENGVL